MGKQNEIADMTDKEEGGRRKEVKQQGPYDGRATAGRK
jgi:hypothetical protein